MLAAYGWPSREPRFCDPTPKGTMYFKLDCRTRSPTDLGGYSLMRELSRAAGAATHRNGIPPGDESTTCVLRRPLFFEVQNYNPFLTGRPFYINHSAQNRTRTGCIPIRLACCKDTKKRSEER